MPLAVWLAARGGVLRLSASRYLPRPCNGPPSARVPPINHSAHWPRAATAARCLTFRIVFPALGGWRSVSCVSAKQAGRTCALRAGSPPSVSSGAHTPDHTCNRRQGTPQQPLPASWLAGPVGPFLHLDFKQHLCKPERKRDVACTYAAGKALLCSQGWRRGLAGNESKCRAAGGGCVQGTRSSKHCRQSTAGPL